MSVSEETRAAQPPVRNKKRQRRNALMLLTLLFVLLGAAYTVYWFMVLRHHESTDNAYVTGNQVIVMSQVSGSVTTVSVDNTDYVTAGTLLVQLDETGCRTGAGKSTGRAGKQCPSDTSADDQQPSVAGRYRRPPFRTDPPAE